MNFLGLVFSVLLIVSFGTLVMLETQWGDRRLRSTYLGAVSAHRKLFAAYDKKVYQDIPSLPKLTTATQATKNLEKPKTHRFPKINPECSRLNLSSFLEKEDPALFKVTVQLLKECYGESLFKEEPEKIPLFLKTLIQKMKHAHEEGKVSFEKLDLGPSFQKIYYAMLKGSKKWSPLTKEGIPSLLDLVKIDKTASKICLIHAHLGMYVALFGEKVGVSLFEKIREEPSFVRSLEWLEGVYGEAHQLMGHPEVVEFVELNHTLHKKNSRITLVAEDPEHHISFRKTLQLDK